MQDNTFPEDNGKHFSLKHGSPQPETEGEAGTEPHYSKPELPKEILASGIEETKYMNPIHPEAENTRRQLSALSLNDHSDIFRERYGDESLTVKGPLIEKSTGETYKGQVKGGVPHGWGEAILKDGTFVEGFFWNGYPQYFARVIYTDGGYYEGDFKGNSRHGRGKLHFADGKTVVGHFSSDLPDGECKIYNELNKLEFSGNMVHGKKSGHGVYYNYLDRYTYNGNFIDNLFEGHGKKEYKSGKMYDGEFKNGLEHGLGELVFEDGRKFKGSFANGVPHGLGTLITDEGTENSTFYRNGKKAPPK